MNDAAAKNRQKREEPREKREPGTSPIEWVVAGLGCLLLVSVIAYLVFDGLSGGNGPAEITVEVVGVTQGRGGYIVEFSAANRSGQSAAAVEIKGELRKNEETVEESGVTLDYVPQLSETGGALMFRNDPGAYELRVFAAGYTTP